MTPSQIQQQLAHRPWTLPERPWQFYQEWNDCIFLHWRVPVNLLASYVPDSLTIDEVNGSAWVSVVAFSMERIRPRYLPPFPPISNFGEINIRTYVRLNGRGGVYFLSIEGGKRLSCWIARTVSELPYRYSRMQRRPGLFTASNTEFGDSFQLAYQSGEVITDKSAVDRWLTERYGLFQPVGSNLNTFEIHHPEWPVHRLEVKELELHYSRFAALLSGPPDLAHYSPGVPVLARSKVRYQRP
jgi:uncharacterized protein YqjF (DUF2071 family)